MPRSRFKSAGRVVEDMPNLPQCCGDASQSGDMCDRKDPIGDAFPTTAAFLA